jgi:hypothetical protein
MRMPVETPVPELDLLDVQAWRVYWAEIERRIGTVFARAEMRARAMAYLAGLLGLDGKTAGSWPRSAVTRIPIAFSICWAVPIGSRQPCAIGCAPM